VTSWRRKSAVIGAVLAAIAIGAGVAVAGGVIGSDKEKEAFLADAAKRLDVTPAQLQAALKGAYEARIDAAVAAGKITKEQGEAMKQRAKDGVLPPLGGRGPGGFGGGGRGGPGGHFGMGLSTAATYLGLTESELRTQLMAGKSLADIANAAEGKTVAGLEAALTADAKEKLDAAVKAGRLTQAQADEVLKRMTEHLDDVVNGKAFGGPRHGRHGWGGPPEGATTPPAAFVPSIPAGSAA
jgi:hypothetical protein